MRIIWVAVIGSKFDEQYSDSIVRRWRRLPESDLQPLRDETILSWKSMRRRDPDTDGHLIVLIGSPWFSDPHYDRNTYVALSEIMALQRANQIHLSVVAPTRTWESPDDQEQDTWRKRCQPLLDQLLEMRNPDSDSLYRDVVKTLDVWTFVDKTIAAANYSQASNTSRGRATLFLSYSHRDEDLRDGLTRHLKLLERTGLIELWHDRRILPGDEWAEAINTHLYVSDLILLLISADFFASDYCAEIEVPVALDRHNAGSARAIPVILRPVVWAQSPLSKLQALPKDALPVMSWESRDLAFVNICEGILANLVAWKNGTDGGIAKHRLHLEERYSVRRRILDAALPANVEVGRSAMLVMLVRKVTSAGLRGLLSLETVYAIEPDQVQSTTSIALRFPLDEAKRPEPLSLSIVVQAPEFDPPFQQRSIVMEAAEDSQPVIMMVAATKSGKLSIVVELRHNDAVLVHSCPRRQII